MNSKITIALAAAMLAGTSVAMAQAQSPVVHASRGQSAQQQARDESACQTQARKRTGYDPISIAANSQPFQPGKDMTAVPIEAPTTAMGASSAGTTSAGAEPGMAPGAAQQETGTMPPSAQAGTSGAAGTEQAGGMEHAKKHHKKHHEGAAGGSAAGATGAGGQEFAMQNSLEVYNKSYATCLKGRGYVVETTGP